MIYIWDFDDIIQPISLTTDVNRDGIVDIKDLIVVATNFNKTGPHAADINGDGVVDITDLIMVAAAINLEAASPAKTPYKDILKASSIKEWLKQAQIHNLTDPVSKRGIYFLEQLLKSKYPEKTAALPNYPNPFNPETWIPYQLSEPSDVINPNLFNKWSIDTPITIRTSTTWVIPFPFSRCILGWKE